MTPNEMHDLVEALTTAAYDAGCRAQGLMTDPIRHAEHRILDELRSAQRDASPPVAASPSVAGPTDAIQFVQVGKTVARFVEPPVEGTITAAVEWQRRVTAAACDLTVEGHGAGLVVCTREYFDQLRETNAKPAGQRSPFDTLVAELAEEIAEITPERAEFWMREAGKRVSAPGARWDPGPFVLYVWRVAKMAAARGAGERGGATP